MKSISKKLSTSDVISYAIKYVQYEINKCEDILNKFRLRNSYDFSFISSVRNDFNVYKSHLKILHELHSDCLKRGV